MIGGFQVGPFQPLPAYQQVVPRAGQTPAGRGGAGKKRKRYFLEIDGQTFEVASPQHAQAIVDRAKEVARTHAQTLAQEIVPTRRKVGKRPVELPTPTISSPNPELAQIVTAGRKAINEVYRSVSVEVELAYLMARQEEDDDDETILLLM